MEAFRILRVLLNLPPNSLIHLEDVDTEFERLSVRMM